MNKPAVVYVTYIASTPEAVWEALTSPEFTSQYWGGRRIQSYWTLGADVRSVRPDGGIDWQGEVLEADPPHLLSYSFHMLISEAHIAEQPSILTFRIEPAGPTVKLTLTHEHTTPDSVTEQTTMHGWPAIVSSLKSLLETGHALPFSGLGFGPRDAANPGTR